MIMLASMHGCSAPKGFFVYDDFAAADLLIEPYPIEGEQSIAPLYASKGYPISVSCTDATKEVLVMLIGLARSKGGNAIGDIRWLPKEDMLRRDPTCKKRWVWAIPFPFLFTSYFMKVDVSAQAYKLDLSKSYQRPAQGTYMIPKGQDADHELANAILN